MYRNAAWRERAGPFKLIVSDLCSPALGLFDLPEMQTPSDTFGGQAANPTQF